MSVGAFKGPEKFVPKLIFASKTGRTEVSTRPDGAVRIDLVANSTDELGSDEVARLIARLTAWQEEVQPQDPSIRTVKESHPYPGVITSEQGFATGGRASIPLAGERQGSGAEGFHRMVAETFEAHRPQVIVDPNVPEGTVYAVGSCSCAHRALDHGPNGCLYRAVPLGDICPCSTPVSRLASKATGTGEQP